MLTSKNALFADEIKSLFRGNQETIGDTLYGILKAFRIETICCQSGITKIAGYSPMELLSVLLIFPFFLVTTIRSFILRGYTLTQARKDTFFRLLNNETIHWRRFLLHTARRGQRLATADSSVTCGILDDTLLEKTGKRIEGIGKVYDHVKHAYPLGFRCLVYAFFNGNSLIPLDFSLHAEKGKNKKRPNGLKKSVYRNRFRKQRDAKTPGAKRLQELNRSKIVIALQLIRRAARYGFVPNYILADSWFATKKLINGVRSVRNGSIHFLGMMRQNKQLYGYDGNTYTAKNLRRHLQKKIKRNHKWRARYIQVVVNYKDVGEIQLTFCRFSRTKKWTLLVSTDTRLSFKRTLELYAIRWNIEVMFKECKQHLNLGKCQSNTFDAQIASTTLSFAMYTMLVTYKTKNAYETIGALFDHLKEQLIQATLAERLWQGFLRIQQTLAALFNVDIYDSFHELLQNAKFENLWQSLTGPVPLVCHE